MLTKKAAETIVLRDLNAGSFEGSGRDRFVIQTCELSERGDFWIVTANSERFVRERDIRHCYMGASAYLVDRATGEITIVGSGQNVEDFLQDIYDEEEADGRHYVLASGYVEKDNDAIIRLRQLLSCGMSAARDLICGNRTNWLTGRKRVLQNLVTEFAKSGIRTRIDLLPNPDRLAVLDDRATFEDAISLLTDELKDD